MSRVLLVCQKTEMNRFSWYARPAARPDSPVENGDTAGEEDLAGYPRAQPDFACRITLLDQQHRSRVTNMVEPVPCFVGRVCLRLSISPPTNNIPG